MCKAWPWLLERVLFTLQVHHALVDEGNFHVRSISLACMCASTLKYDMQGQDKLQNAYNRDTALTPALRQDVAVFMRLASSIGQSSTELFLRASTYVCLMAVSAGGQVLLHRLIL